MLLLQDSLELARVAQYTIGGNGPEAGRLLGHKEEFPVDGIWRGLLG